jgi:hypothetical protein
VFVLFAFGAGFGAGLFFGPEPVEAGIFLIWSIYPWIVVEFAASASSHLLKK